MSRTVGLRVGAAVLGLCLGAPAGAQTLLYSGNGQAIEGGDIARALQADNVAARFADGERLTVAGVELVSAGESRALVSLSTEFLTVAVTAGRLNTADGRAATPGQALVVALDGDRVQRLAFNAARLSATLSPGARSILGGDLDALAHGQRRAMFWGGYQPLRVNARAPGPAALETARLSYLAEPAIVQQRRRASGIAGAAQRGRIAVDDFLAAVTAGDARTVAALIDPAPFLAAGGPAGVGDGRLRAANALLGDAGLRSALSAGPAVTMSDDGASATIDGGGARWRLALAARDRAVFVQSLEVLP